MTHHSKSQFITRIEAKIRDFQWKVHIMSTTKLGILKFKMRFFFWIAMNNMLDPLAHSSPRNRIRSIYEAITTHR